jgi:subtilisin family serine protease
MLCIITPSFIAITLSSTGQVKGLPNLYNAAEFYGIQDEPYIEVTDELLDVSEENVVGLPSLIPYWYDLVDKEKVSQTGAGVYVAVLDTGLLPNWNNIFSEANIAWELGKGFSHDIYWDDTIGDIVISDLKDDRGFITNLASGHGTHVASTIVGYNYRNLAWIEGIASDATIIPVLVLDAWLVDSPYGLIAFSGGTNAMIAAGIYYITDLAKDLDGPVIINMSLGGSSSSSLINDAIDYAIKKGVIIVVAAGNAGTEGMDYPGAYPSVISRAAGGWTDMFTYGWRADVPEVLYENDSLGNEFQVYLEDFSGRPNRTLDQHYNDLDVMAPGAWIVGPYKPNWASPTSWGYYYVSGTSMATPHVSAIAALVLELFPWYNQKDVELILQHAANGVFKNILRGFPPIGIDVKVAYIIPGYYYLANWGRHDFGRGFLNADDTIISAFHYFMDHHHHSCCCVHCHC